MIDPDALYVDQGESSRRATDKKPIENFGLLRCADDSSEEMSAF